MKKLSLFIVFPLLVPFLPVIGLAWLCYLITPIEAEWQATASRDSPQHVGTIKQFESVVSCRKISLSHACPWCRRMVRV
jgi:hypothetical protein